MSTLDLPTFPGGYCSQPITRFPGGFAWPSSRYFGLYITCPSDPKKPFGLAVHDDFGMLQPVPSRQGYYGIAIPTSSAEAGPA